MKHLLKSGLFALVALILTTGVALAAYSASIIVTESDGTAYDMLACNVTANIEYMADNDIFAGVEGLDTRVMLGTAQQKHMLADDRIMFATPMPANSSKALSLTTGSSNLTHFSIIPGYSNNSSVGYISVSDNVNLELSDNFTTEMSGWIDTDNGTNKNLVYKSGAFRLFVSDMVAENVTSTIMGTSNATAGMLSENGLGNWVAAQLVDGNIATRGFSLDASGVGSYVRIDFGATNEQELVEWRYYVDGAATKADWTIQYSDDAAAWNNAYTGFNVLGSAGWHECNWGSVGAYRYWQSYKTDVAGGVDDHMELECYAVAASVTATGVESGEHIVKAQLTNNLTSNGSFEVGDPPDLWTLGNSILSQEGTIVKLGNYSLKIRAQGTYGNAVQFITNYADYAGKTVTLGAWVYAPSANTKPPATFNINDGVTADEVSIPADDTWHWLTVTITVDATPTQLRQKFYANLAGTNDDYLYVDGVVLITESSMPESGNFILSIDGSEVGAWTDNTTNFSVPNNDNDWTLMENNVMPYSDNISFSISGTTELWFRPIAIIADIDGSTATLPDRTNAYNHGVIHWGSNPSGVAVSLGILESDYEPYYAPGTGATQSIAPEVTSPLIESDAVRRAAIDDDPLMPAAEAIEEATGGRLPVLLTYWWGYIIASVVVFIWSYDKFNNLIIAGILFVLPIGFAVSQGIFDWWVIAALVLWLVGCVMMEGRRTI